MSLTIGKEDINKIRHNVNGKIALSMRAKSPRFSIETDKKKNNSKFQCRGKYRD